VSEHGNLATGFGGRGIYVRHLVCAGLVLTAACVAQTQTPSVARGSEPAYESGKMVSFTPVAGWRGKSLVVGDLRLGRVLTGQRPSDHRPNLYVVCPGFKSEPDKDQGDYGLVLSTLPRTSAPIEWDVYWVVVLDPASPTNLTGESDLLMAEQKAFTPGPDFDFADIPGVALLRKYLHIDSRAGLGPYELAGGDLPTLIMVPAHITIRAGAFDPETLKP